MYSEYKDHVLSPVLSSCRARCAIMLKQTCLHVEADTLTCRDCHGFMPGKIQQKRSQTNICDLFLWSWRESNPRPNKEAIRFLHAYSRLHFRATARPGPPTGALSSKISSASRGSGRLFPIFLRRFVFWFGTTSSERRLVPSPGDGIKPVIYCTSIRQRERSCFRQLIVWPTWFRSPQSSLRMLTYHLILLSNPVNPKHNLS